MSLILCKIFNKMHIYRVYNFLYFNTYRFPPLHWKAQKGLFESFIHLNFKGNDLNAQVRQLLAFPDGTC
jgi:hypothetical protein